MKELGGESIVAYKQDDIVKIHVHTNDPGKAIQWACEMGELVNLKIDNMAEERRDTRIALMRRHEQVKDSYQQPWNLRNHSIFMQFFEDLRNYIDTTPADKLELNFFDMRHFASERFMWLR